MMINYAKENNLDVNTIEKKYKLNSKSTDDDFEKAYEEIIKEKKEG